MSVTIAVNQNIIDMEYAVRGPIPQRAAELRKQGRSTIACNIGNPQALGQKPITFYRQILSLLEHPDQIQRERMLKALAQSQVDVFQSWPKSAFLSDYVLDLAELMLSRMGTGMGAYTDSNGPIFVREAIARFINHRDGQNLANPDNIFMTNGASEGARFIIELLIGQKGDGIMIPIPQYPLYSATIKKCGGTQVNYYPDEDSGWTLNQEVLETSIQQAHKDGIRVKAIVVINPGNPTGAIIDEKSMRDVIEFAKKYNLLIIADEVYQENVYGGKFVSFAHIVGSEPVPLLSLHSTSKGFYGECGHRGGYLELRNPPAVAGSNKNLRDLLLKQSSVSLCSNTIGQMLIYLMVSPPAAGTEPYAQFQQEKETVLKELYDKAMMIKAAFKQMHGMQCFGRVGAMYLFPRLEKLPAQSNDYDYCLNLLETTGITTVNGTGFGQKPGTQHLRIAFLPPKSLLEQVLPEWIAFHNDYVNRK